MIFMQEEKQNICQSQERNNYQQRDKTQLLVDINDNLFFIKVIVILMFLLQLGVVIFVYMFGMPVFPVWYY